MPDQALQDIIAKGIAQGLSDEDITLVAKAYQAQHPVDQGGIGAGITRELKDQYEGVKNIGGALVDVVRNLDPRNSEVRQATLGGMKAGELEGLHNLAHPSELLKSLDPTGISSVVTKDEPLAVKGGRTLVLGAEAMLPFARRIGGLGRSTKAAAQAAEEASKASEAAKIAMSTTQLEPALTEPARVVTSASKGVERTMPGAPPRPLQFPRVSFGPQTLEVDRPSSPAVTGTGAMPLPVEASTPPPRRGVFLSPTSSLSTTAGSLMTRGPEATSSVAQRVAGGVQNDFRGRVSIEPGPEVPPKTQEPIVPQIMDMAREDQLGMQPGVPTQSLAQMVAEHGEEGAAQRAGMTVDELRARILAGNDPDELAKQLRLRLGAEKAARLVGQTPEEIRAASGGGPSRIPAKAVEQIKAAAAREVAATGQVSEKTQKLLDRIKSEGGAAMPRALLPLMGAAGGATLGGMVGANSEDRTGNAILGGAAGGLLGLTPAAWVKRGLGTALGLRREGFLTGAAIPKNVIAAAGAGVRATGEGLGTTRLAPAVEMARLPTNVKNFWNAVNSPRFGHQQVYSGPDFGRFAPSHIIGAIDDTAMKALRRAGVPEDDILRMLTARDDNMFRQGLFKSLAKVDPALAEKAKDLVNHVFPFQRVPTNIFEQTFEEGAHTLMHPTSARALMNLLSIGGGEALGQWAGHDPKKRYLATILLAAFGTANGLATIGAAHGAGVSGFGASAYGGISPVPEQALDPKSFLGAKPAALSMIQRLGGK